MTRYGYIRKGFPYSETDQIRQVMTRDCEELFFEGGTLLEVQQLEALLTRLETGDQVIVASLQVFGQNMQHLTPIITEFKSKQIQLVSLQDQLDTRRDSFFYPLFEVLSVMDSECKSERIKQQIVLARDEGKVIGRPAIDETTIDRIYQLYHEYKWSMRRIATECGVSLGSVFKYTQPADGESAVSV
ncbi:recombinase family protein [Vagococcus sp. BWB3-3]|uniref:Recombinase family protein n=1 Tax=Vagococcus allomyrinae TaxID=2794353 RepID=A0A940P953_9ENTE|nr:recombinase family protein [Vagococcus allomyrinae]MBP1040232.1 recombinase family protein [Vagococcus allomyrinae]